MRPRDRTEITRCTRCPDLREYCAVVAREKRRQYQNEEYWGKPVPAFGDEHAQVVLVGLAPGAHGSNRTGRMFTGDASGDFLYPALYRAGLASQPLATSRADGMELRDCFITAAARCAPPENKPLPRHLQNCFPYLAEEFERLSRMRVAIGLGSIGFAAAAKALLASGFTFATKPAFGHAREFDARKGDRTVTLLGSYHPSRQNTNTGVLTVPMFDAIFARARAITGASCASP